MVEEIVKKAEQAGDNIRLLDDRKMSLSWAGVKGFLREVASDGLAPALVVGAIGAAIAGVGITATALMSSAFTLVELAPVIAYTAGAAATAAAGFIGARGAIEDVNIARKTNVEIDHAIGLLENEGFSRSKDSNAKTNKPFVNVTGGISLDEAANEPDLSRPTTSISTRDAIVTSIANRIETLADTAVHSMHR